VNPDTDGDVIADEMLRAQHAFHPFVTRFGLSLNPEDIDVILHVVLHFARTPATAAQIADASETAMPEHLQKGRRTIGSDGRGSQTRALVRSLRWIVWRQDDNGARQPVSRHETRDDADQTPAAFEARGHKRPRATRRWSLAT
jgi:hypothetical protein